jgi:phosphatidylinositol alpha-1,6-mannosyltransferase
MLKQQPDTSVARRHRILMLVTDAFGGYGGIAQYNRDLISAFAETSEACDIDVFPRLAPCTLEPLPRSVKQHAPIGNRVNYTLSVLAFVVRKRPTIVFNGHLYHGPLAHRIAGLTGAKLVSQLHGTEIWGNLSRLHRRPLEASDLVFAVSRDTRAKALSKIDIAPEKVVVLSNTVGADFRPADRRAAREHFGLSDEFAVLTVARLDAREGYKGHDRVVPLIARANAQGRRAVYLIAGTGNDEPRLRQLAKAHDIEDSVRFLGKVPRIDLPDLYRAADLFALPSTGEGFGISFLEAMACGTPAIGLAAGGAPDALGDGKLGICVEEKDFAAAFLKALTDAPSDARLSAAVHTRFGFASYKAQCSRLMALAS